jgi:transposase
VERVRKVGPEKFGILAVDSSKKRFAVLLTDFYRKELSGLVVVENTRAGLEALIETVKALCEEHALEDLVAAVERTGRYHVPVRNALKEHWTVRMVHPFATKQLRQPADPGTKTELADLRAIVRQVVVGYGAEEPELPERWGAWRLVSREREDLVRTRARVRVQTRERLEALMAGYGALFKDLWGSPAALALAAHYGSGAAVLEAGFDGVLAWVRQAGHLAWRVTVSRIVQWATEAPDPDPNAMARQRLLRDQADHLEWLSARIGAYERDLADYLVDTPFVLLLAIPGINVVSSASYGAELGPIEHYLNPKKIAGRAGLYPSRYQSDEVDLANGPMVGHRNARLRDAILEIAHNLLRSNEHTKAWAHLRRERGWPAKKLHVAVGNKFARISYWILAGRMAFRHPFMNRRDAVLRKLVRFGSDHALPPETVRELLLRASRQLPSDLLEEEARALGERLRPRRKQRSRGGPPVRIGDILREIIEHLAPALAIEPQRSEPSKTRPPRTPH